MTHVSFMISCPVTNFSSLIRLVAAHVPMLQRPWSPISSESFARHDDFSHDERLWSSIVCVVITQGVPGPQVSIATYAATAAGSTVMRLITAEAPGAAQAAFSAA